MWTLAEFLLKATVEQSVWVQSCLNRVSQAHLYSTTRKASAAQYMEVIMAIRGKWPLPSTQLHFAAKVSSRGGTDGSCKGVLGERQSAAGRSQQRAAHRGGARHPPIRQKGQQLSRMSRMRR
jgi:hypothetical protein